MPSDAMILEAARRLVRQNGATSVEQLGAAVADGDESRLSEDEIRVALRSLPQIRWLDGDGEWLWIGGRGRNRVLYAIEKILSVARSIEIASLCEGVRRVRALREWRIPHEVVGRLCIESRLSRLEGTRVIATQVVREWRVLLGRYESAIVWTLHAHGPTMTREHLKRHAAVEAGLSLSVLGACLRHSPIVEEVGSHGFRLRGVVGSTAPGAPRKGGEPRRSAAVWPSSRPGHAPHGRHPISGGTHHLPRGRHGLPREAVAENQRARLLDGIVEVVARRGYGEATIAEAVATARVSRKTFYELFADKEACFAAACERWLGRVMTATRLAFDSRPEGPWAERAQLALGALLAELAADPLASRAFVVEAAGAGTGAIARRDATLRELAELVDLGRSVGSQQPPGITSQVLIGGLEELVRSRILHGATAQLPSLLPDLVFCLTQPLVGTKAAAVARERARQQQLTDDADPVPA